MRLTDTCLFKPGENRGAAVTRYFNHKHRNPMTYAIETLQKELRLVREGLASWGPDYQDIKKRQENKVKELEKAILHLQRSNENPTLF